MAVNYIERQRWHQGFFFWPFCVTATLATLIAYGSLAETGGAELGSVLGFAALLAILILLLWLGFRSFLAYEVTDGNLALRIKGKHLRFDPRDVVAIQMDDHRSLGFFQASWGPFGLMLSSKSFNVSGTDCIVLHMRNQEAMVLWTRDAHAFLTSLQSNAFPVVGPIPPPRRDPLQPD